jgi:hypothetical protein
MSHALVVPATSDRAPAAARDVVISTLHFNASPEAVWRGLMFYEQIDQRPPWYLRLLLPVPIRTEGRKSIVGDEALCLYVGGHLVKRVTRLEPYRLYGFAVIEQNLDVGGIVLSHGEYALRALPDGGTEVGIVTHYTSPRRPRWLWRPIEALVCHAFHHHILRAMRHAIEKTEP